MNKKNGILKLKWSGWYNIKIIRKNYCCLLVSYQKHKTQSRLFFMLMTPWLQLIVDNIVNNCLISACSSKTNVSDGARAPQPTHASRIGISSNEQLIVERGNFSCQRINVVLHIYLFLFCPCFSFCFSVLNHN